VLLAAVPAVSAAPVAPPTPPAARALANFDVDAATNAWLATYPKEQRAKSDAYFEGSYWLLLWDSLATMAIMLLLLETKLSARMRDLAERLTRVGWLQWWLYWIGFCTVTAILLFPLTAYEGFFRERSYGLMNQTFAAWFRDQLVGFLVVGLLLGGVAFVALFAVVRGLPRSWHIWGTGVAVVLVAFSGLIEPVFIAPLFNKFKPLEDTAIRDEILSLARSSGVAAQDVYEVDASRQSKRVSAFVSGFANTERITLNDNLLNRVSPQGVLSVMGHEIGHYVMHHILDSVLFSAIVFAVMFALLRWFLRAAIERWGARWRIEAVADPAMLPLAVVFLTVAGLLFTPIGNTYSRMQEYEADLYGLQSARQPDGEAEVDVLLGEYRKLDPGPMEEFLFYDHPSGRTRIHAAMRWKAENLCLFNAALPCGTQPNAEEPATAAPTDRSLQHETHR
jgi:STE24 endopeptidase